MPTVAQYIVSGLLIGLFCSTLGNLNLFIRPDETKKLLGVPSELYYIRDGVVNSYALQFSLLLQAHMNDLYFVWRNDQAQAVKYSINFTVSNREALGIPQLNISRFGEVPTKLSVFRVNLKCTELVSAEVDVTMQMNFSDNAADNVTVVNFKRRKICLKDKPAPKNDSVIVANALCKPVGVSGVKKCIKCTCSTNLCGYMKTDCEAVKEPRYDALQRAAPKGACASTNRTCSIGWSTKQLMLSLES